MRTFLIIGLPYGQYLVEELVKRPWGADLKTLDVLPDYAQALGLLKTIAAGSDYSYHFEPFKEWRTNGL